MPYKIGHSAYTGANRLGFASCKSQAEAMLRDRGLTRDGARELIKSADTGTHAIMHTKNNELVECVVVDTIPFEGNHPRANIAPKVKMPH